MRRIVLVCLTLLLAASLLVGCGTGESISGSDANSGEKSEVTVDTTATLLPDLERFLRSRPYEGRPIEYVSGAYQLNFVWLPHVALEDVTAEVLALLSQPQYQLSLRERRETTYYGWTVYSYYYDYTGSGEALRKYRTSTMKPAAHR